MNMQSVVGARVNDALLQTADKKSIASHTQQSLNPSIHDFQMLTQRASLLRKHAPIAALIIRCSSTSSTPSAPYDTIETTKDGPVGCITINRPSQLNALNSQVAGEKKSHGVYSSFRGVLTPHITYQVMHEVVHAARAFDGTEQVRTILLTGKGDKAFAAGADIKEMQSQGYADAYNSQVLGGWEGLRTVRKPLIAAVNGYALGGGCEVAMLCDIIVASDKASFGQVLVCSMCSVW